MSKYSVAVIGCGSIGALKDYAYDRPGSEVILTHAHAFYAHPDTELHIVIDRDGRKAVEAANKWHCSFNDGLSGLDDYPCDIVVIATPTETHLDTIKRVLVHHTPKLIVAEKPFCSSLEEAVEAKRVCDAAGVPILVNYTRRFDPVAAEIFEGLRDNKYGEIYHARCLYGRGLKRDGCHGIDIFNAVFGQVLGLSFDHHTIVDHLVDDPSYTLRLEYERCREVYMVGTDSRKWGAFELDFITAAGVIRFTDWGKTMLHFTAATETTYGQYKALSPNASKQSTGLTKALLYMADNCVAFLDGKEQLKCTPVDAMRVHEIMRLSK